MSPSFHKRKDDDDLDLDFSVGGDEEEEEEESKPKESTSSVKDDEGELGKILILFTANRIVSWYLPEHYL